MTFTVRFTVEAEEDLLRLYQFILDRDDSDWMVAAAALDAIKTGILLLEYSPFSCRKATAKNPFIRELVIPFGHTGFVVLLEILNANDVLILAVRHQREADYH